MKITRDTPDQLILEHRNFAYVLPAGIVTLLFFWLLMLMTTQGFELRALLIVGLASVAAFVVTLFLPERSQLILDTSTGLAEHRRKTPFGYRSINYDLSDIDQIGIERSFTSQGNPAYRARLEVGRGMSAGQHLLTRGFDLAEASLSDLQRANEWLDAVRG
ncbi:hypothetical protein [Thalassococcus sp. S3]|uniref:hypothetical protein n=1 Tax=Thalassococcus sp. S3 TaxID=2017482 RepID=UPI0010242FB5|nr:hypothetical protein [Thalassococcus sp. S3]QBF29968.1 hypothetical protein CFI11_01860 [Thalassococcus sp. S3]